MSEKTFRSDRFRRLREQFGDTQQEFAERLGIHLNQIHRYETGAAEPTPAQLKRIALTLGVTLDWLLGLVDDQHEQIPMETLTPQEQQFLQSLRDGNFQRLLGIIQQIIPNKQK